MSRLAVAICSFGYVGFCPIAPGTAGSAVGLVVYLLVRRMGLSQFEIPVIALLMVLGVWLGADAERALGRVDPGPVVIDEVMGMLITLAFIPVNWLGMLLGFLTFRALDVVKPFPARRLESLPGGLGMMADDAMAAIYANLLLRLSWHLAPTVLS
jgi:phosphatidylglycerophosphatase A